MEIQEKAPNKSGNIDKNNNTHKDYNVKNREAFSSSDVVEILQKYKTALVKKLNKRVHLFWNQEENKIDWSEAQPPLYQNALPGDIELKKETVLDSLTVPGDSNIVLMIMLKKIYVSDINWSNTDGQLDFLRYVINNDINWNYYAFRY